MIGMMKMRKMVKMLTVLLLTLLTSGMLPPSAADANEVVRIGIIQVVEHPAFDASREGFIAALRNAGIPAEFDYQNAQGDIPTLSTIAQRFVSNNVDLVLAVGTSSVQAIAAETYSIPIVGTSITSYVRAGVAESNEAPGFNVTGAANLNPIEAQIKMILEFMPDIQTLGMAFSSSEANSVYQVYVARGVAESLGLTVIESTVTSTIEVQQNAVSLAGRVDAIWIPTDNTHANAMPVVGQVSIDTGVPVFAAEDSMTMGGAVASLGIDYFELGYQSGGMAIQILRGEGEPATMPIQFPQRFTYVVNGFMADALGMYVPEQYREFIQYP